MKTEFPSDIAADVVGRRDELRLLLGAIRRGKAVLLLGLPGVSKTTMLRALARHLGTEPDRFVDVTGDEQLTAHALVGGFDPPMVLRDGYRPEHFVPGPLARAMVAGGILYVEEMNRAPSGALNALMTALSEGYVEVPRLGRIEAAPGFTVVGAANPLDDVGTARLSRGLIDRFLILELYYQPREEELEIMRRRCGTTREGVHPFAVDVARESRHHPDLRHGASVRAAIDFVDLVTGYELEELDLATLRFLGCSSYAGKLRMRPTVTRSACAIVHELMDLVLRRDYGGTVEGLVESALAMPLGEPADAPGDASGAPGEQADVARGEGDQRRDGGPEREPDEVPGLSRPGGSGEAGGSRSVPMVERDRPTPGPQPPSEMAEAREVHLRSLDEVLRRAREQVLRPHDGRLDPHGRDPGVELRSEPWTLAGTGQLDLSTTIEEFVAGCGNLDRAQIKVLSRQRQSRNYVILVDRSGSMVGRKLELAATMAAVLAQLSAAGRGDYAVLAFDEELQQLKPLGADMDVEDVVDRILRLPEGRATDLGLAMAAAAELSERLPEATDVVLISDCMPTRGVRTFPGLAALAARVPSLYVCFTDERSSAIQMFHGERQVDLYQWWARQWVGEDRFGEVGDVEEVETLVDLLSQQPSAGQL
jgi:MoxR-like ATPase